VRLIIVSTGIAPRERSTTELAAPPRWRFSEEGALSEDGRQRLRDAANMCSYHDGGSQIAVSCQCVSFYMLLPYMTEFFLI
jgi:hypothetical protein